MVGGEINQRIQRARQAAAAGDWLEAEAAWRGVLALDPHHPHALLALGAHAFQARRVQEAIGLLQAAHAADPSQPIPLVMLASALERAGRPREELAALDAALERDPYCLPALLGRAEHLERAGKLRQAATHFGHVLEIAPPESEWPLVLKERLLHGRKIHEQVFGAYFTFLQDEIAKRSGDLSELEKQRWREVGSIMAGRTKPFHSVCNRLHIPRLPAIPFFDRSLFPWLPEVEKRTSAIAEEWKALWAMQQDAFKPYVAYEPGTPVNQWAELNHSRKWSSLFLWQHGKPVASALEACPVTAEALGFADAADIPGQCPNAMFSVLLPRTRIPPHNGETNARTLVHLPLIVPPGCSYRVGYEWREWEVGKALIFDDTIEHEARNDSDEIRVVLIFEIWNPHLSMAERAMVQEITAVDREFHV